MLAYLNNLINKPNSDVNNLTLQFKGQIETTVWRDDTLGNCKNDGWPDFGNKMRPDVSACPSSCMVESV